MSRTTLVTGGGRSGKSRYALELAAPHQAKAFIATAEAFDEEMRARIARHRQERGDDFVTVEAPLDVAGALQSLPTDVEFAVVDCLTVWLANLLHHRGATDLTCPEIERFLDVLDAPPCNLAVVTNEVGMGIIPDNAQARAYRDLAGLLNQRVAERADRVVLMVSGCPLIIKGER